MKALVTGDRGFVGRHMVTELKSRGWDVYGIDLRDGDDAVSYFMDRDYVERFDLVVHCAYLVGGRKRLNSETMDLSKNLILDASMFDWALRTEQGAVLYFSSSAAYPIVLQDNWDYYDLKEENINLNKLPYQPDANYGWAKLMGERLARDYSLQGGRVHVVRPFSGYGKDQSLDYPFPSIIKRAKEGDLTVWGPKGQTRDWIHISDVVDGALEVYAQDVREPINLCTGVGTEMGDLMAMAHGVANNRVWQPYKAAVKYLVDKPTGVFYRVGDPTKMKQIYEPKITIEEGVRMAWPE